MLAFTNPTMDIAHLLDAAVLIFSFLLLSQRRLTSGIRIFALQALALAAASAWQAYIQDAPHLYITAFIALTLKATVIPYALHRIIAHFKIQRSVDMVLGINTTMFVAVALVILAIVLVFPVTASTGGFTRESLSMALSVVLLGLLMMITRHNAIMQVVGFMSMENGLVLGAVGVRGMPLVVELCIAVFVLIAFIIFGIFFFHIRERFDTLDIDSLERVRGVWRK